MIRQPKREMGPTRLPLVVSPSSISSAKNPFAATQLSRVRPRSPERGDTGRIPMFHVTERLLLRPAWPEDADALLRAIADEGVVRNLASAPWPYLPRHAHEFVMRNTDPFYPRFLITLPTPSGSEIVAVSPPKRPAACWRLRGCSATSKSRRAISPTIRRRGAFCARSASYRPERSFRATAGGGVATRPARSTGCTCPMRR